MTAPASRPDPARLARLGDAKADGGADLLFVGKVSPHKAPHDLVKMLAVYRRLYDPQARLHLVGSPLGDRYGPALAGFVARLGLEDAVSSPARSRRPSSRPTTGRPTCSSAPRTTRASACPWSRPWATACRSWPTG